MRSRCLSCNLYVRQDLISGRSLHRDGNTSQELPGKSSHSPAQSRAQPSPKLCSGIPCPSLAGCAEVPWPGVELGGSRVTPSTRGMVEPLCLRHKSSENLVFSGGFPTLEMECLSLDGSTGKESLGHLQPGQGLATPHCVVTPSIILGSVTIPVFLKPW